MAEQRNHNGILAYNPDEAGNRRTFAQVPADAQHITEHLNDYILQGDWITADEIPEGAQLVEVVIDGERQLVVVEYVDDDELEGGSAQGQSAPSTSTAPAASNENTQSAPKGKKATKKAKTGGKKGGKKGGKQ